MAQQNTITSKYNLIICEIHHPFIHGKNGDSDPNIETHYLVIARFDGISSVLLHDDRYDDDDVDEAVVLYVDEDDDTLSLININDISDSLTSFYSETNFALYRHIPEHPCIRNFENIVTQTGYIRPEIAECIELPTMETIAILKTFLIRIIQRMWKKIFKQRSQIINNRKQISALSFREIHGIWPKHCRYMPQLRGMLKELA